MQTKTIIGDPNDVSEKMQTLLNDGWQVSRIFATGGKMGAFLTHS